MKQKVFTIILAITSWIALCGAIWLSWHYLLIAAVLIHWALSLYPHSMFHHRYASHGQFTLSRWWEKFWFLVSYILQGPSYLSPKAYGIMHRLHHAYADTPRDPHSPSFSPHLISMMWKTRLVYNEICAYLFGDYRRAQQAVHTLAMNYGITEEDLLRMQKQPLPSWYAFDKFANSWESRLSWLIVYANLYFFLLVPWSGETSTWWYLTFVVHCLMAPLQGAIINWFAHKLGDITFTQKNTSRNMAWGIDWFMLGESYHNSHHKRPASANFAFHNRWFIDPIYITIWIFDKLGIMNMKVQKRQ